ncbi:MAG: trypsin-like peptidase domain-containing protein [Chitinophagaceae bacterium]|nr:trypsin-like peptidase domain-containing protein [Chitinophagaceae bacterium]
MQKNSLLENVFHETTLSSGHNNFQQEYEFEVIRQDTRLKIKDTLKAPFKYICSIRFNNEASGTGTLIGPKTVLTAGHVVWDKGSNKKTDTTKLTVVPAMNGDTFPKAGAGIYQVSSIIMSKASFRSSDIGGPDDYAIIHLKEAAGNKFGFWGMSNWSKDKVRTTIHSNKFLPLPAGQITVNICGYPGDEDRKDRFGNHQWLAYNRSAKFSENRKILEYLNDTFAGHSGSPVWVRRHPSMGGRVMVGIHISGITRQNNKITGKGNRAVYINDDVRKFIAANRM